MNDLAITIALLLALAIPSHATLMSVDSVYGPDTVTVDTATGLRWLDLTVTRDTASNEVLAGFPDFTYATIPQLNTFLFNAQIGDYGHAVTFADLVGRIGTGARQFSGLFAPDAPDESIYVLALYLYPPSEVYVDSQAIRYPRNGSPVEGSFLVAHDVVERQTVATPEAPSVVLLGMGIGAAGGDGAVAASWP